MEIFVYLYHIINIFILSPELYLFGHIISLGDLSQVKTSIYNQK